MSDEQIERLAELEDYYRHMEREKLRLLNLSENFERRCKDLEARLAIEAGLNRTLSRENLDLVKRSKKQPKKPKHERVETGRWWIAPFEVIA